jgi:hypothetical protein
MTWTGRAYTLEIIALFFTTFFILHHAIIIVGLTWKAVTTTSFDPKVAYAKPIYTLGDCRI